MIIQIRGTSGSGKSTAMRRVMDETEWQAVTVQGRRRPLAYHTVNDWPIEVVVLGHYETPCGGCDTIGSARAVYDLWQSMDGGTYTGKPRHFLMEGLLLSEDVKWTAQMPDVRCLFLTTPIDVCVAQIKARRAAGGNAEPLDETNTRNRLATIDRAREKLLALGVATHRVSVNQVSGVVMRWLRRANQA